MTIGSASANSRMDRRATDPSRSSGMRALLLAGSLRTARAAPLAGALGLPVASLPVDARFSVLAWWLDALLRGGVADGVSVAVADETERSFYERIAVEADCDKGFSVWIDRNQHRGAGGTVRDHFDDLAADPILGGMLIAECSTFGDFDLPGFVAAIDPASDATVLAGPDGSPCGVMHLSLRAIRRIPTIGYFDLKEQLLPAIAAAGGRVPVVRSSGAPFRISDRRSYLALVDARRAGGIPMISDAAQIDASAFIEGGSLIGRGAVVKDRAIVSGSVVMPGAVVGAGAVVARSVVPPGARIPAGSRIIDEVFASLASGGREES